MPSLAGRVARLISLDERDRIAWSVRWRAIFPHTGFREHQRVPLAHPDVPFILITSQRAGSTLGAAWFFHHAGLLESARAHDPFVHRYEQEVFLTAPGYFRQLKAAIAHKPVVKLARDPGARAFSSYLALHDATAAKDPRDHRARIRRKIAQASGKAYTHDMQLSFCEFLAWAAVADHRRMDGHEARQKNLYEDRLPNGIEQVIRLESVTEGIQQAEKDFGLPVSKPDDVAGFGSSPHYITKVEAPAQTLDEIMYKGVSIPRKRLQPKVTTQTISDYPDAHRHLLRAFGTDYKAYGYAEKPQDPSDG